MRPLRLVPIDPAALCIARDPYYVFLAGHWARRKSVDEAALRFLASYRPLRVGATELGTK